jgi:branched-chain amino acid aminotransferase
MSAQAQVQVQPAIYLDGRWVSPEEAKVSIFDHGYLYGDGVFEGIRSYAGKVFRLEEHVARLYESAHAISLTIPMDRQGLEELVREAVARRGGGDAYIRVQVSRGHGDLGLDPRNCPRPSMFVVADRIALYPPSLYETGLRALTVSLRRTAVDALSPRVKSLNYLNNILGKIQATAAGMPEAIFLNADGFPIEATGENLFAVRRGELWTPPAYLGILEGITRRTVLELAQELGMVCHEEPFNLHDLYVAEEVFLTGTAAEIVPVVEVDGRPVGTGRPGPVVARLREAFARRTGQSR